jgi:hypothetical protein
MTLNYSILKVETCSKSLISRGLTASRAASALMSGHFFHALPYEVLHIPGAFSISILGMFFLLSQRGKRGFPKKIKEEYAINR